MGNWELNTVPFTTRSVGPQCGAMLGVAFFCSSPHAAIGMYAISKRGSGASLSFVSATRAPLEL